MATSYIHINSKHLFYLLLGAIFALVSCSTSPKGPFKLPTPEKASNFTQGLKNRAEFVKSIIVEGRAQLKKGGKKQPSVKFKAWFDHSSNMPKLRIKASGAFGITIFDMLAVNDRVWIYLGKDGKIYTGKQFFTNYGNISVKEALALVEMIFNPWSPALYHPLKEISCPKDNSESKRCLSTIILKRSFNLWYSHDFSPLRFFSRDVVIIFKYDNKTSEDTSTYYPKEIAFMLTKSKINGKISVKKVELNKEFDQSVIFDPNIFSVTRNH